MSLTFVCDLCNKVIDPDDMIGCSKCVNNMGREIDELKDEIEELKTQIEHFKDAM